MAMIDCRECGATVSSEAKTCPQCGIDNPHKSSHRWSIVGTIIGLIIAAFIFLAQLDPAPETIVNKTTSVDEDKYWYNELKLNRDADIKVHVELLKGPAVDLYFIDQKSFNVWNSIVSKGQDSDNLQFRYYEDLSLKGLSSSFTSPWVRLAGGKYHIIVDNTDYGAVSPPFDGVNNPANVSVKVEVK